jgi:hypothetical protein
MFKMAFNNNTQQQLPQRKAVSYGSNFSFANSGTRQLPNLLMNISNTGKGCGGCGKK